MKCKSTLIWGCLLLAINTGAIAQVVVTVTNPTNATPNLAASYTSLALAITALDAVTSFSGPVTLTCAAGSETAPAGGYSINFTAATTPSMLIVITGTATTTITASAALTPGALNDAVFKIIGSDHVTIKNFTMQENPANTITAAASNNMTEFGVALFYATASDGAYADTIMNNVISLNRTYTNTFGIYSNTRTTATAVTTLADGARSLLNGFSNNTISNVNMGIALIGIADGASHDQDNAITGNTITNWGGAAAASAFVSNSPTSYCIYLNHQDNAYVLNNTITSATLSGTAVDVRGIFMDYSVTSPTATSFSSINNNIITITDNFTSGILECISIQGMTASGSTYITINGNTILNTSVGGTASSTTIVGIANSSSFTSLNIIGNVIRGTTSTATTGGFTGISNTGAFTNSINIVSNHIGNASGGAITMSAASAGFIRGIYNQGASPTIIINQNSIDGISCVTVGFLSCIQNSGAATGTIDIKNNQLGTVTGNLVTFSGVQASTLYGIFNSAGTSTCTLTIQANDVRGIVHAVTGNCAETFIIQNAPVLSANILNNTFTNLAINNGNDIIFIANYSTMASGASFTCNNNQIVTAFSKTAPGGLVLFLASQGNSVSGSTITATNNNFSNVTINGGGFEGWDDQNGISTTNGPTKTITGNTFNNITHTGAAYQTVVISIEYGVTINCSSNTISNISSTTSIYGIAFFSAIPQIGGSGTISSNTISGLSSTGGNVEAIFGGWLSATNSLALVTINNNTISNISSTAPSAIISGIDASGVTATINNNVISGLSGTGTGSPSANGIIIKGGTTINVYKNDIHTITESGVISTTSPAVNGMLFSGGTTVNAYNNFISDLKATGAGLADAVRGISVTSTTASSTYNIYYNSVYMNAASTGTNFGTSGIYHTTSATATIAALNMIDNIIVNTSTPAGTGVTAAYRRSDATLTNYTAASDYNLLYAGTPSASRLIYYDGTNSDQTLAAYQTRVSTRDANSISVMPTFTSTTDLHLTTANCWLDGRGTPVAGITTDIDAAVRNVTTPDMGADEFTATSSTALAGVAGSAVCENRTVSGATTYISNACDIIATVLPSGGAPVAGKINVCVTLDASQLYFNAEPYVQRHYDIEPATSNQTTTSASITLYFNDAEFALYNTTNPAWPKLPTIASGGIASPFIGNVKITQFHGTPTGGLPTSTPGNYTGTRVLFAAPVIALNGTIWAVTVNVAGFSGFYVHSNFTNTALPVIINYFTGQKQGNNHLLNWKVTCNSTPSVTMTLERSSDSRNFTVINAITADALRCNQPFNYTDAQPMNGMNYYRLKMVDAGEKISYSSILALLNATKGFDIVSIAPNPVVTGNFKLNVASAQAGKMDVSIFDMQGRLVNRQSITLIAGFNSMPVNVANLSSGTYTIRGGMADEQSKLIRFVKQ